MVEQTNSQINLITQAVEAISNQGTQLVESMGAVAGITEDNTASTQEMSANSWEMVRAIQNVAAIAEENSVATEEVSAAVNQMGGSALEVHEASQTLDKMAREVQEQVGRFRI
jgi:methyl-accepting chemotaxis protein